MTTSYAIIIDICVVLFCILILKRYGRLTIIHPAVTYLFFHFIVVTQRLITLHLGLGPIDSLIGLSTVEILRAGLASDLALIAFTLGSYFASIRDVRSRNRGIRKSISLQKDLLIKYAHNISIVTMIIGILAIIIFPNKIFNYQWKLFQSDILTPSSYIVVMRMWPLISLSLLIYIHGFRWFLLLLIPFIYFITMISSARFASVIPSLFLIYSYITSHRKKWGSLKIYILICFIGLFWFGMKPVVRSLAEGKIFTAKNEVIHYYDERFMSKNEQPEYLMLLDMMGSYMTQIDRYGSHFYGVDFLLFFLSPIPRQLWQNKPKANIALTSIGFSDRPTDVFGMSPSFTGYAYIDFGYTGVIMIPFLFSYFFSLFHFHALRNPYFSISRLLYLLYAAYFILIYRGGLLFALTYPTQTAMPIMIVIVLCWINKQFVLQKLRIKK